MRFLILGLFVYFDFTECMLWPKGVVHYAINKKDYDIHSQDEILSAFETLEKELCIKFFDTPLNYNASTQDKILYINNPNKQKNCPPATYNYSGTVVDMTIGYKCINKKEIARITVEMLKASIDQTVSTVNSYDLVKLFQEQDQAKSRPTFLTTEDRNYINAHYNAECTSLASRAHSIPSRRDDVGMEPDTSGLLTAENQDHYGEKIWPLGIVMYTVNESLRGTAEHKKLLHAMTQIELASCVVFHEAKPTDPLLPNNQLSFSSDGDDWPQLGLKQGTQTLNINSITKGAPGHSAHTLNNLLRALGVPMLSNRYDRDNYVTINWHLVKNGHEHLLEKAPKGAWVQSVPYDFESASHAPANYLCDECKPGQHTVLPLQDTHWQRTMKMGHTNELSAYDKKLLNLLYADQCKRRTAPNV